MMMVQRRSPPVQVLLLSLLSLLATTAIDATTVVVDTLHTRHDIPPADKTARFNFPLTTTLSSHFLATATSTSQEANAEEIVVCAPERDGYFGGGTGGAPTAQLHIVGTTDRAAIVERLLSVTFPSICDDDDDNAAAVVGGRVTGYHFGTMGMYNGMMMKRSSVIYWNGY